MADLHRMALSLGADYAGFKRFALAEADRMCGGHGLSPEERLRADLGDAWPDRDADRLREAWRLSQPPLRARAGDDDSGLRARAAALAAEYSSESARITAELEARRERIRREELEAERRRLEREEARLRQELEAERARLAREAEERRRDDERKAEKLRRELAEIEARRAKAGPSAISRLFDLGA